MKRISTYIQFWIYWGCMRLSGVQNWPFWNTAKIPYKIKEELVSLWKASDENIDDRL